MVLDWANLWSGGAGAVLGAVVSIGALIGTNWWTRRMNDYALEKQAQQFQRERDDAEKEFREQQAASKESTREMRELDVVAELLTWLQVQHERTPLSYDRAPELMALCNRLILNSTEEVADGWRERTRNRAGQPTNHVRVERHPLAQALIPWAAAYSISRDFPDTVVLNDLEPKRGISQVIEQLTEAWNFQRRARVAVELVSRRMLRWAYLTSDEKIGLFDDLVSRSIPDATSVLAAINYSLGWVGSTREAPYWRISGQPELMERILALKEIADPLDRASFDLICKRADELGGALYRPPQVVGRAIHLDLDYERGVAAVRLVEGESAKDAGDGIKRPDVVHAWSGA